MRIFALYSIKGGVGKTATSVNLAYLSSFYGMRTILCDLDPQGSSTYYFRIRPAAKFGPKKFLRGGTKIERKIRGTDFHNLDLLPSSLSLRNLDIALDAGPRSKRRLKESLLTLKSDYEYMFLDCPPNITIVSENIFRAADHILVPFIPTTLSLVAFEKLLDFFDEEGLDSGRICAFFSMAEVRKRMHTDIMLKMLSEDRRFLRTAIPFLSDIERMGIERAPVVHSKPYSLAARRYRELWEEIKVKMKMNQTNNYRR
jgi:cellulose biosynthesis protein BcsQ